MAGREMAEHEHHGNEHAEGPVVNADEHERIFANLIRISAWNVLLVFIILAMLALTQT